MCSFVYYVYSVLYNLITCIGSHIYHHSQDTGPSIIARISHTALLQSYSPASHSPSLVPNSCIYNILSFEEQYIKYVVCNIWRLDFFSLRRFPEDPSKWLHVSIVFLFSLLNNISCIYVPQLNYPPAEDIWALVVWDCYE